VKRESLRNVGITAIGAHLPEEVLDNAFFESILDTSDEWIRTRSGVLERRRAPEDEATSDLAVRAAQEILDTRGIKPTDLDMIITATVTPDHIFPSTGNLVQSKLGATDVPSYDVLAACTGFIYALTQGYSLVSSGLYDKVLVLGAECMTRILDYEDRSHCFLFGDAAAGFLLEPTDEPGIIELFLASDGSKWTILHQKTCGSKYPVNEERLRRKEHLVYMEGREVFKHAVRRMAQASDLVLERSGWTTDDVDWFFAHQANIRIIDSTVKHLKLDKSKNYVTIDHIGNTTAASIPYGMYEAYKKGKLKKGDKVLITAFGGGFTWGSGTIVWQI
jgi:3-oxoacyl-[acyl-carrier-protein] synthase-3